MLTILKAGLRECAAVPQETARGNGWRAEDASVLPGVVFRKAVQPSRASLAVAVSTCGVVLRCVGRDWAG